jgi:formylglycine-generating enzyme required for sulfatase activity
VLTLPAGRLDIAGAIADGCARAWRAEYCVIGWTKLPVATRAEMPNIMHSQHLCRLPAGTYWIGSDGVRNASPRHVRRFAGDVWLDRELVTWHDFVGFVSGGGYADTAWWRTADGALFPEATRPSSVDARCEAVRSLTLSAAPPEWTRPRGDLPVLGLTWFEAAAVCHFFSARLPFETEWEAATMSGILGDSVAVPEAQEWCLDAYASRYWRADAGVRGRAWQAGQQVVLRGHSAREPAVSATTRRSANPAVGGAGRGFRRAWERNPAP